MAGDIEWANVSLLLKANGTGGATSFTDSSDNGLTCTGVGGAALSATGAKFDGMSIALGATGSFNFPTNAALTLAGDFTLEFFTSGTVATGTSFKSSDSTTYLYNNALTYSDGSITGLALNNTLGVWKHIAITRSGTTVRVFQDGVLKGTGTTSVPFDMSGGKHGQYDNNLYLQGSVDELRITKGVARYTADFTPPTTGFEVGPEVGIADAALTAPSPTLVAEGVAHAYVEAVAPSPTLLFSGGANLNFTAPSPTLIARGHNSYGEQAAFLTAPSPLLTITTGAHAKALTAPSPTLTTTGTVTILATATLTAPSPTLASTGKVSGMANADLSIVTPYSLIGYSGAVCSVSVTGSPTLTATGTTGGIGRAELTCPLFELTASGTAQNYGSADLIAPSPRMGNTMQAWITAPSARLTAIGSAVITATYEAYAINLRHTPERGVDPVDEVTRYTNFPFTHVVRYQNSYYGANSTGLYLLEGTTDDGTPIPWAVETAMTDFDSPTKKTLASAYFSGRFGPASTIQLKVGEGSPIAHSFTTPRGQLAQNHRQVFGKGSKSRYYALAANGTDTLELDGLELDVKQMTRRI